MCGLAALFSYRSDAPKVDQLELKLINDRMVRRGPDGEGFWYSDDGRVGLSHRRLAIIDLSEMAHQPMGLATQNRRYLITYNGEIYNFRALRSDLQTQGYAFVTQSDTEVLLRLYERYGSNMVYHLRGMFALVIWDTEKREMFITRDPFGIKPLYYADNGRTFRAASQVKALLAGGAASTGRAGGGGTGSPSSSSPTGGGRSSGEELITGSPIVTINSSSLSFRTRPTPRPSVTKRMAASINTICK